MDHNGADRSNVHFDKEHESDSFNRSISNVGGSEKSASHTSQKYPSAIAKPVAKPKKDKKIGNIYELDNTFYSDKRSLEEKIEHEIETIWSIHDVDDNGTLDY